MDESREIRTDPRPQLLSIVTPVFREGAQLAGFLSAVRSAAEQCSLAYELLEIEATGDKARAGKLLDTYGKSTPEMDAVNARLKDIPVDIAPIYVEAGEK